MGQGRPNTAKTDAVRGASTRSVGDVRSAGKVALQHRRPLVERQGAQRGSAPVAAIGEGLGEARAIRVKADVVSSDLRESRPGGLGREVLNYGHTFAHAVEQVEHYTWKHGHAVSVGLVFVAALARLAGRLDPSTADEHGRILRDLGLPTAYAANRFDVLLDAMRVDKKSRGDRLRFVVLDAIGSPGLLEGPSTELLAAAYAEVSKEDA